jgi:hypothetical protein
MSSCRPASTWQVTRSRDVFLKARRRLRDPASWTARAGSTARALARRPGLCAEGTVLFLISRLQLASSWFGRRPAPFPDLQYVLPMLTDICFVLDQLVAERLLGVSGQVAELR